MPQAVKAAPAHDLHVWLLGAFRVLDEKTCISLSSGSARLLGFLALAGGPVARAQVAGTLWPETSESHAFGNLRSALSRLGPTGRRAVRADSVHLELEPCVRVDVRDARALALRLVGSAPPSQSDLTCTAVMTLSKELLPGWYDDWALMEAEDWRQLRLHALEALASRLAAAGRFGEAVVAASASVRGEPLRESAHACLISVHLAEGNRMEALRQFDRLRALLRFELGIEPSPRIRDLLRIDEAP